MGYTDKAVLQEFAYQDTFYTLTLDGTFLFECAPNDDLTTLRIFTTKVDAKNYRTYLIGKLENHDDDLDGENIEIQAVSITKVADEADRINTYSNNEFEQGLRIVVSSFGDSGQKRDVLQLYPIKDKKDQN